MSSPHRRALLGTVLAGGAATVATAAPASAAAFTATQLRASSLKVGDLVVGPAGAVVRVAVVTRLASGRYLLRYTDPGTGAATPFDAPSAATTDGGHAATRLFAVLARGVAASTVRHVPPPAPSPDRVVDGGAP